MADEIISNIYLVNAPAGSGKTTTIKERVQSHIKEHPMDNILCITYTKRAADELLKSTKSDNVYISTIHSYVASLVNPLFQLEIVSELYFELFEKRIKERISNPEDKENITKSNQKYEEEYGELNFDNIKKHFKGVSYGESQFTSLYTGKLSHDDLLYFARKLLEKFPKTRGKINKKFQIIYIDEYQDTSDEVLELFFQSVVNTNTKLYFFGDKMQQIYPSYSGTFENIFSKLRTEKLSTNYRSLKPIIDVLNNLYNDKDNKQQVSNQNIDRLPSYQPKIIISNEVSNCIKEITDNIPDTLVLHLFNSDKFNELGAGNLYRAINEMEKYSFEKDIKTNDVLTNLTSDNKDEVMRFLFLICEMNSLWKEYKYGKLIQLAKKNYRIYNSDKFSIAFHGEKKHMKELLSELFLFFNNGDTTILDLVNKMDELHILSSNVFHDEDVKEEYELLLKVRCIELINLYYYVKNPMISTQHGVKGESHDSVVFVAKNSNSTPVVHMYKYFKLISEVDFSLTHLEKLYYDYIDFIIPIHNQLGCNPSGINASVNNENKEFLLQKCNLILDKFSDNIIFQKICADDYQNYIEKQTVANAKKCFKESKIYGVLSAYRLFYVGCSRARNNLTIVVNQSEVLSFKNKFIKKFQQLGFEIYENNQKL